MKVDLFLFFAFLSQIALSSMAIASPPSSRVSLCEKGEATFFSCVLENKKIVSLCGDSDNLSSTKNGYVQYRFGSPSNMEMMYPKKHTPPVGIFFKSDNSGGSVTTANEVFFNIGNYKYILGYAEVNNGYLAVVKGKDEPQVFFKRCDKKQPIIEIPQDLSRFEQR